VTAPPSSEAELLKARERNSSSPFMGRSSSERTTLARSMNQSKEAGHGTLHTLLQDAAADPPPPKALKTREEEEEEAAMATAMRAVQGHSSAEILSGMDKVDQEIAQVEKRLKECHEATEARRRARAQAEAAEAAEKAAAAQAAAEAAAEAEAQATPAPVVVWDERRADRLYMLQSRRRKEVVLQVCTENQGRVLQAEYKLQRLHHSLPTQTLPLLAAELLGEAVASGATVIAVPPSAAGEVKPKEEQATAAAAAEAKRSNVKVENAAAPVSSTHKYAHEAKALVAAATLASATLPLEQTPMWQKNDASHRAIKGSITKVSHY